VDVTFRLSICQMMDTQAHGGHHPVASARWQLQRPPVLNCTTAQTGIDEYSGGNPAFTPRKSTEPHHGCHLGRCFALTTTLKSGTREDELCATPIWITTVANPKGEPPASSRRGRRISPVSNGGLSVCQESKQVREGRHVDRWAGIEKRGASSPTPIQSG